MATAHAVSLGSPDATDLPETGDERRNRAVPPGRFIGQVHRGRPEQDRGTGRVRSPRYQGSDKCGYPPLPGRRRDARLVAFAATCGSGGEAAELRLPPPEERRVPFTLFPLLVSCSISLPRPTLIDSSSRVSRPLAERECGEMEGWRDNEITCDRTHAQPNRGECRDRQQADFRGPDDYPVTDPRCARAAARGQAVVRNRRWASHPRQGTTTDYDERSVPQLRGLGLESGYQGLCGPWSALRRSRCRYRTRTLRRGHRDGA